MTGAERTEGRAVGLVASFVVHLVGAAIALTTGILGPGPQRDARSAAPGVEAAASASALPRSEPAKTTTPRQAVVPRSLASSGPAGAASGRKSGSATEYAMLPGEGFVDSGSSVERRTLFQALLSFSRQVESRGSTIVDHLWQSTLFVVAAAMLSLAFRRNRAEVRYRIWFAASVKFLVPFALLAEIGRRFPGASMAQTFAERTLAAVPLRNGLPDNWTSVPFTSSLPSIAPDSWVTVGLIAVWACGFTSLLAIRFVMWQRIRRTLRASRPLALEGLSIPVTVDMRSAPGLLEPGVVGWSRPVLLMPAGIEDHLTIPQLETVIAHEMCHVRRQDNFTAAVHMGVEAIFWFHPMVWWIGARLVDERERACDEAVLGTAATPQLYAEAILGVCKRYVESPLVCVAGVSGSSISARIAAIVRNQIGAPLPVWKRGMTVVAASIAIAGPVAVGVMAAPRFHAHMQVRSVPAFALVPARADGQLGPQLIASTADCDASAAACVGQSAGGRISGRGLTTAQLADLLSAEVKTPVVDRAALKGRFDIDLSWASERAPGSIFAALRDQLGLTLQPTTASIEVVVIEP